MRNYTCAEYVNTANLRRILRARKVDRDQLTQLKSSRRGSGPKAATTTVSTSRFPTPKYASTTCSVACTPSGRGADRRRASKV